MVNIVPEVTLKILCYKGGCRIQSVPLKKLTELSKSKKRRWELTEDNWLVLTGW